MLFSSRNYAIGMAHYQIGGGLKTLLVLLGGYVAVAATILGLIVYNVPPAERRRALVVVATLFLVMEGFGLVFMGAVRLAGCLRMDATTTMLESHRQMPISAARAMLGYLLGTTSQVLLVVLLNIGVLGMLEAVVGVPLEHFVISQVVLFFFTAMVWTFSAMEALMFRQFMAVVVLLFVGGGMGSMFLQGWGLLPGASLLTAPFLGETIFTLARGRISFNAAYPVAIAAQAAFTGLFFLGACRRYRGTYLTTFNVAMGAALTAVWGALSVVAILIWPTLQNPIAREFEQPSVNAQVVAALCVAALLMLVPAQALAMWESHHGVKRSVRAGALAAMVLAGVLPVFAVAFNPWLWFIALAVLAIHAVTIRAGLRVVARATPLAGAVAMGTVLFVLWMVPVLIEVVRWFFLPENRFDFVVHDFTFISSLSPLGVLLATWQDGQTGAATWVGLAVQLGVAWMLTRAAAVRARREASEDAQLTGTPPQSVPS